MKYQVVTEEKFARLSANKEVKNYMNDWYKEVDGKGYYIVPKNEICKTSILTDEEKKWWCKVDTKEEVVMLSVSVMGCFPHELVAGLKKRRLLGGLIVEGVDMNTPLAAKTGWLEFTGNIGSRGAVFLKSKVNVAIDILNQHGLSFEKVSIS